MSEFEVQVPFLTSPDFQQRLVTEQHSDLGFLHLNVRKSLALVLLKRLQMAGATGDVARIVYRHPKLRFSQAYRIAMRALKKLQIKQMPEHTFSIPTFYSEEIETWTFIVVSPQLLAQGYIPGGLLASVDKIDGHVWQPEEYTEGTIWDA